MENEIQNKIVEILTKYQEKVKLGSDGSYEEYEGILSENFTDLANELNEKLIKDLQHFKDTSTGLWATDKNPSELFELTMQSIDGDTCMSAVSYEYYKKLFDDYLSKLLFRL